MPEFQNLAIGIRRRHRNQREDALAGLGMVLHQARHPVTEQDAFQIIPLRLDA
jgi:hypothetical protein